jgi:hypothetical protein
MLEKLFSKVWKIVKNRMFLLINKQTHKNRCELDIIETKMVEYIAQMANLLQKMLRKEPVGKNLVTKQLV